MKLTTKRDRWYFWRELFLYMIPMILIVSTIDVFFNFMQCPLHPEYSAPCSIIWMNAIGYGFFLIITIIFAIFSARKLRKVKKRIENEFLKAANNAGDNIEKVVEVEKKSEEIKKVEVTKPKKIIVKSDKKATTKDVSKKGMKKTDGEKVKTEKSSTKKKTTKK